MKAVLMRGVGGPDVLSLEEVPTPEITGPTQIRVRLRAAGINPVDTKLRSRGTFYPDRMPAILGLDGAGVVDAVGAAVSRFEPGDEVYFCHGGIGGDPGTYAEYTVLDEAHAAPRPKALGFEAAAAAPLVLLTAWESLHDMGRIQAGMRVLIHAGAGGVGHVAIQLAKRAGAQVITTVSSRDKADFVEALGADAIVHYREQDVAQAVMDWTGGRGVDLALDTVGGAVFAQCFPLVRFYGDVVTLLQPPADTDWKEARLRNQRIGLELMLSPMYFDLPEARRHQTEILEQCGALFDAGKLHVHVAETLPLAQAAEAHRRLEAGGMIGKLVLAIP